ncbi:hypothetical protein CJ030_MR3G003321 [Morella rubra]|uniref:non-specific serine/threonine protein kinase n=1 Tax=Morella rubra TaxID=262757 RepID=A0A6A1W6I6_9ROSI|nr:hypothetical protein CJ030_MR3G003321 [Morella rubra]
MMSSLPHKTSILHCSFMFYTIFLTGFISLLLSPSLTHAATTLNGNETDRLALLALKARIITDPFGIMSSWNESLSFCNWVGVTCGSRHQRVTFLNLSFHGLVGSLSPQIGNLSFLTGLNLELNYFNGEIPQEVGRLFRLKYLNLTNNSFSGEIPANLSGCSSLIWLRLGFNKFSGKIPFQLGSLQKLERVQLHYNNLSGPLPEHLGNLSSVRSLSLAVNSLEGTIPDTLGRLKTLEFLGLGVNQISGMVPPSIFNISSIQRLSLPYNQLHGNLPLDLGFNLPNLLVLNVGHNQFNGPLPASLSNASNLLELDTNGSNFTGKITIDFGGLPSLWWLVLASNSLGKGEADDLNFFKSLSNCRNLKMMDLSDNQLGGTLPYSIANLSTKLVSLRLGRNQLTGSIPTVVQNIVNLTELTMEKNHLTGEIPAIIGNLRMLRRMDFSENAFSGHIPSSLANATQLYSLHLEKNLLTGTIPSNLGNLLYLQELDLSRNFLNGTIPKSIMSLSSLSISLNLAQNQLTGSLPTEVGNLNNLGFLDISENKLSGGIPSSLGSCVKMEQLHMASNSFEGTIPESFSSLRGLQDLDLSHNNLSGQIPNYFELISLVHLNLSFNDFQGEVPSEGVFKNASAISIAGNSRLCGGLPELKMPPCKTSKSNKGRTSRGLGLMIGLLSALLGLVLIMSLLVIHRLKHIRRQPSTATASTTDLLLNISYRSLLEATSGFSSANLIGAGSFGSVYKGILHPSERVVAIKVLNLHRQGASRSFMAECEALRNIRHRNLVKLLTACSSIDFQGNDFKALIYEFIPNGSLESWLHSDPKADEKHDDLRILSLIQRLNIAIDVASALDYLHHQSYTSIVHCDLKPSNILLDNNLSAHVGDFGLSRVVAEASNGSHLNQSSSVGLKGTVGYAAPEYGMGSKVSKEGDVYSYGILLLEMFTGKRPTDDMFKDGLNLHIVVETALPEGISEILDPLFVSGEAEEAEETTSEDSSKVDRMKKDQLHESLVAILRVGVACSEESARDRMKISDAIKELRRVRDSLIISGLD